MTCRHVRDWLHRDTAELDDAQRLLLDDHLAGCERCRGDRARLRQVHAIGTGMSSGLEPRDLQRAIARALVEGAPRREPPPVRRGLGLVLAGAALAAAATAAIVLATRGPAEDAPAVATPTAPAPAPSPAPVPVPVPGSLDSPGSPQSPTALVEAGAVRAGTRVLAAGATVPAGQPLTGEPAGATLRLHDARVVLGASAEVQWMPVDRQLLLDRGSLDAEADTELVVVTGELAVTIAGGAATVARDRVDVHRGTARLVARDGRRIASLSAGQQWTAPIASLEGPPARTAPPKRTGPDAAELISRARRELAARSFSVAEDTLREALRRSPTRGQEVAARVLLAEAAQGAGRLDVAIARYTEVASTYTGAAEAESSLYAAARLERRAGRPDRARSLLETYLSRYPRGRYVDDVRRELALIR